MSEHTARRSRLAWRHDMSKPTPGPWVPRGRAVEGPGGMVALGNLAIPQAQAEANARLMAAALRLLEVLEAVREELDNRSDAEYVDGVPRGNWAMRLLGDVDAVIAKARGGTRE